MKSSSFLGFDVGTSGTKAVLVDATGTLRASASCTYALSHPVPHWAEQDPADWWQAVVTCTRRMLAGSGVAPEDVAALSFAGQMLGLVPVDATGNPTRPAISWLDNRADREAARLVRRLGGRRVLRTLAGAVFTGKDIVPKVAWLRVHEADVYARTHAFCDVTGYLVARATGQLRIDHTGAAATGLLDRRRRRWSPLLARVAGFPLAKMPPVVPSTAVVGGLTAGAARDLGLPAGLPVAMGLADIASAAVGAGALGDGAAHVYLGTSSWLCVSLARPLDVGRHGMVSVPSAAPGMFIMIGESETAGACVDWLAGCLGMAAGEANTYRELNALAAAAPAGARGLLFAPWLFGERSPVGDTDVRGAFLNLDLQHRRADLARAVFEGVALNLRWLLDAAARARVPCRELRAIGGGTRSDVWLQIIADVTGRPVRRVAHADAAGAIGCALVGAVAVGALPSVAAIADVIATEQTFTPDPVHAPVYERLLRTLRDVYPALSRAGRRLNTARPADQTSR